MQRVFPNGFATCPKDVLIVEDDPLIALVATARVHGARVPDVLSQRR